MSQKEKVSEMNINPPNYNTLLSWWDAWPEARPPLLDFWARGNYTRRILARNKTKKPAYVIRVQHLDEMETALKRLALLEIDTDFLWCGDTSKPSYVLIPQDIKYEDSGGWGYLTTAGTNISGKRGKKTWCPTLGYASLLPDTVTDWLATQGRSFLRAGRIMVAPIDNVGLNQMPGQASEIHFQRISNSSSIVRERAKIETLFELELPYLEGMSMQDTYKFYEDEKDKLILLQRALAKILNETNSETPEAIRQELLSQIRESVAELRLSDKTIRARKLLGTLGASISTFLVTFGVTLGLNPGVAAAGSVGAAMAVLAQWDKVLDAEGALKKNPFYVLWQLQKGKGPRNEWRDRPYLQEFPSFAEQEPNEPLDYHWLTPPTAGWRIPIVADG